MTGLSVHLQFRGKAVQEKFMFQTTVRELTRNEKMIHKEGSVLPRVYQIRCEVSHFSCKCS